MTRRSKHKKRHPKRFRPSPQDELNRRRGRIVLEFVWALIFFVLLVYAKEHFVDHSVVGEHIKQATYDISQVWLAQTRDTTKIPIVVVDIGDLPACAERRPDGSVLYPRQILQDAVTAVIDQKPAAVAIDIDFSPGSKLRCDPITEEDIAIENALSKVEKSYTDRGGQAFFNFCNDLNKRIYLGIYRTQYSPPKEWLGGESYADLAATIALPMETEGDEEIIKEPDGIRRSMTRQIFRDTGRPLESLSFALSKNKPRQLSWVQRLLERMPGSTFPVLETMKPEAGIELQKFLVDFSSLSYLEKTTVKYADGKLILNGQSLTDKLVLMGYADAAESIDKFIVPGDVRQVAGVYWHATAVDTLLQGILAKPTKKAEFFLDALFYVPIVLLIFGLRMAHANQPERHIAHHRIESVGTKIAAVIVFLLGTYFVRTTRIMWDGFLLVAIITALHPTLASYFNSTARWLWSRLSRPIS